MRNFLTQDVDKSGDRNGTVTRINGLFGDLVILL
jgi:hypothetical protein